MLEPCRRTRVPLTQREVLLTSSQLRFALRHSQAQALRQSVKMYLNLHSHRQHLPAAKASSKPGVNSVTFLASKVGYFVNAVAFHIKDLCQLECEKIHLAYLDGRRGNSFGKTVVFCVWFI